MSVFAELHDGRRLEFPDGTDPSVIQRTVKKVLGAQAQPQGASAIPVEPGANTTPTQQAPMSFMDKVRGVVETPIAVVSNAVTGPITYLAGAFGPKAQQAVSNEITYQPRTQLAQNNLEAVGRSLEATKLPPFMPSIAGANMLARSVQPVTRAAGDLVRSEAGLVGDAIKAPFAARAAATEAKNAAGSYANAAKIEAAQEANRLGIAINPSVSNPTLGNKIKSVVAGNSSLNTELAAKNVPKWTEVGKAEMGIPATEVLTPEVYDATRSKLSGPYDAMRGLPTMTPSQGLVKALDDLKSEGLIGGAKVEAKITALVEDAKNKMSAGLSGDQVVDNIRQLRKDAQTIYNSKAATTPKQQAVAATNMGIANTLESLLEENINNPTQLGNFRAARAAMAKTFDYEKATDFNTGNINPAALAKLTAKGGPQTGDLAAMGKIAGNFPEVTQPGSKPSWQTHLTRSGVSGTIGAGVGALAGQPILGGVIGAGLGEITSKVASTIMAKPGYQAANAVPKDYRPPVNNLRPVTPNVTTNSLVPYDYANAIAGDQPNWVYGRPDANVRATGVQFDQPQLPTPSAESTLAGVKQRRGFDYRMAQAMDQPPPETPRAPTGFGVQFDLDPITGRLVPTSAGIKGATPEVFMANTGLGLQDAAEKVAAGRLFDMTAAEKIAWSKTKVDLAQSVPELSKLSDKAVAGKIMDREWVNNTMTKLREQAQAFDDIASRATDAQKVRQAVANRERLLDAVSALDESLRPARPASTGIQGPKTRAAIRNNLAPQNQNALAQ